MGLSRKAFPCLNFKGRANAVPTMSESSIYLRRRSSPHKQEDPLSIEEFLAAMDEGSIRFSDYVWRKGLTNWVLAGSLALVHRRGKKEDRDSATPPDWQFTHRLPEAEAEQRAYFLRLDQVQIYPGMPASCEETIIPLALLLSSDPDLPGGRTWRKLATEMTSFFAARARFEQASLLRMHPLRVVLKNRKLDHELGNDEMLLLATEELKRQTLAMGGDLLVEFKAQFSFVPNPGRPTSAPQPVLAVTALAARTLVAVRATQKSRQEDEISTGNEPETVDEGALKELREREAFILEAEARVMEKMEEQQLKEAELAQKEDDLRALEQRLQKPPS